MLSYLKWNLDTIYCVLLSNSNTHLVISIQSTLQIQNRYSLQNHSKPSFFLLYLPFNQSIILTKNVLTPYPARFLAFNLTTIVSSALLFKHNYGLLEMGTEVKTGKFISPTYNSIPIEKEHRHLRHHYLPHDLTTNRANFLSIFR